MRGNMNPTPILPPLDPTELLSVGDVLAEKFGGTWEFDETNRIWISQRQHTHGQTEVTWWAELTTWAGESDTVGSLPHHITATIQVYTKCMWMLVGMLAVGHIEVETTGGKRMWHELLYMMFGSYPESGHDSPIDGPIDNHGECGMIP